MDNEYNPDIITIVDEEGCEHVFEELDRIETDDARYVALLPVYDETDDILEDDGEFIILKVIEENGEDFLTAIEDDDEFNRIGSIFEERLEDMFEVAQDE
ncbi:MAG: DUF1292 domain-containing protein [Oscillospiraceae bacterium]|jgi:uncharacterized protein YrzB (UPF0473 family)|nr:DUF1292 domain-containing protein [Oscillospiraceae bacterium]